MNICLLLNIRFFIIKLRQYVLFSAFSKFMWVVLVNKQFNIVGLHIAENKTRIFSRQSKLQKIFLRVL